MYQHNEGTAVRRPFSIFYTTTTVLLMGAVAIAFVQKQHESAVAATVAMRAVFGTKINNEHPGEVGHVIHDAEAWAIVGFTIVLLAILSWSIAVWRHERCRWTWVCVVLLLFLYVLLELTMV